METTDILTFLAGLISGSFLTVTVNYVRKNVINNDGGEVENSSTKSDQRRNRVGGDQAGRDIRK